MTILHEDNIAKAPHSTEFLLIMPSTKLVVYYHGPSGPNIPPSSHTATMNIYFPRDVTRKASNKTRSPSDKTGISYWHLMIQSDPRNKQDHVTGPNCNQNIKKYGHSYIFAKHLKP
uniref:Uncharacterized protein n=1 Tax=Pyxicephalus adspersus TaxID=30357 RepID=A0AAV3AGT7_PYXAD|nr:TPA: hypothetical protein GDO54_013194 [Pyxicephalus adspersus]